MWHTLSTGCPCHIMNRKSAQIIAPSEIVAKFYWQWWLGPKHNVFGRTPTYFTFRQEIDKGCFPVFDARGDPCQKSISVDELRTGIELSISPIVGSMSLFWEIFHMQIGRDCPLLQDTTGINLNYFRQRKNLPTLRNPSQRRILKSRRE